MPPPRLSLPAALLISLALVLVTAGVLFWMGLAPACPCPFKLWVGKDQPQQSQHLLDWYTYTHVLHGVVFCDFGTVERNVTIKDFRVAPGAGLRITVPAMGPAPLAFDFNFPVAFADTDTKQIFAFFVAVAR